jgi:hypothetical protein
MTAPEVLLKAFDRADSALVARAIMRLVADGTEAHALRCDLVKALLAAAELAGDKTEAADLRVQFEALVRRGRQA